MSGVDPRVVTNALETIAASLRSIDKRLSELNQSARIVAIHSGQVSGTYWLLRYDGFEHIYLAEYPELAVQNCVAKWSAPYLHVEGAEERHIRVKDASGDEVLTVVATFKRAETRSGFHTSKGSWTWKVQP